MPFKRAIFNTLQWSQKYTKTDMTYLAKGGFWLSFSQIITIVCGVGVSAIFANILTDTEYGTYRYLIGIGVFLSSFALTGLGQSVLQMAAKNYKLFYQETIKTSLVYNLGVTFLSIIGAIYYSYNNDYTLALGCVLIAVAQPLINTYQNIFPFLQGSQLFRESTIAQGIKTIIVSIASITALLLTNNILILLATYFLFQIITNIGIHLFYRDTTSEPTPKETLNLYKNYAKHTSLRTVVSGVAFRLDTIIIFSQLGASELAIYTISLLIPEQIKGSIKNLGSLILPKFAKHTDIDTITKNLPSRMIQLFVIFSVISALYIVLSPFIYSILFPKYEQAIFYSQLLALSFPAMVVILPYAALQSQLKERELYIYSLQNSILTLVLCLTLTLSLGVLGAVLAKVLSRYGILCFMYLQLRKYKT